MTRFPDFWGQTAQRSAADPKEPDDKIHHAFWPEGPPAWEKNTDVEVEALYGETPNIIGHLSTQSQIQLDRARSRKSPDGAISWDGMEWFSPSFLCRWGNYAYLVESVLFLRQPGGSLGVLRITMTVFRANRFVPCLTRVRFSPDAPEHLIGLFPHTKALYANTSARFFPCFSATTGGNRLKLIPKNVQTNTFYPADQILSAKLRLWSRRIQAVRPPQREHLLTFCQCGMVSALASLVFPWGTTLILFNALPLLVNCMGFTVHSQHHILELCIFTVDKLEFLTGKNPKNWEIIPLKMKVFIAWAAHKPRFLLGGGSYHGQTTIAAWDDESRSWKGRQGATEKPVSRTGNKAEIMPEEPLLR